jgi:type II secretory pathway component PulF
MEEEIKKKLQQHQELLEKIYKSVEKTRKYFLWTLIISLVVFVIPLIILIFILPSFVNILTSGLGGF